MICSVTGMINIPTLATISQVRSRWRPSRNPFTLLDRVDLLEDRVGPDLLRVVGHDRVRELLHLRAVGEGDALQLPGLLHRVELGRILRGLDLAAVGARLLARLEDGGLQVGRKRAEGLPGEADR